MIVAAMMSWQATATKHGIVHECAVADVEFRISKVPHRGDCWRVNYTYQFGMGIGGGVTFTTLADAQRWCMEEFASMRPERCACSINPKKGP